MDDFGSSHGSGCFGIFQVENEEKHHSQMKRLPAKYEILEEDLETDDRTLNQAV